MTINYEPLIFLLFLILSFLLANVVIKLIGWMFNTYYDLKDKWEKKKADKAKKEMVISPESFYDNPPYLDVNFDPLPEVILDKELEGQWINEMMFKTEDGIWIFPTYHEPVFYEAPDPKTEDEQYELMFEIDLKHTFDEEISIKDSRDEEPRFKKIVESVPDEDRFTILGQRNTNRSNNETTRLD